MRVKISKRTMLKFAEFATAYSAVNPIARAYEAEGFKADPNHRDAGGARRSVCASFHSGIDSLSSDHQRRLMNVYLDAITSWGRQSNGSLPELAIDVVRSLQRDGFPLDDAGHLTGPLPTGIDMGLRDLRLLRDPGVIEEHLDRMLANVEGDPAAVIGTAKELVESVCKAILEDRAISYLPTATLPDLYKAVAAELRLSRESVQSSAKGSEAAQRVLQGLVTSVQNLAELRNALGLGHGRAQRIPALERHARLAMNASRTIADFLLSTWHERKGVAP
jgi:abortive infection Abi-like protein